MKNLLHVVPPTSGSSILFKVTASGGADAYVWKQNSRTVSVAGNFSPELAPGGICEASVAECEWG
jgi:hypothetical protein